MHNDNWGYGMDGGGWWIAMALMMAVFWGGLIWLGVTLLHRSNHPTQPPTPTTPLSGPSARETLDGRLARGEIEVDDYRQRPETLTGTSKPWRA